MIKELQILVEIEKALKLMSCVNFSRSQELKSYLENIRNLQLQSFVENETYNFVLTDALHEKEKEAKSHIDSKVDSKISHVTTTYTSRH